MAKWLFAAVLTALLAGIGTVQADDSCGPGCHSAVNGGCVVNGWDSGAPVWNECPAGAHPRPTCGAGYVWSRRARACMIR